MRAFLIGIASLLALASLATLAQAVFGEEPINEQAAWDLYEEKASKAEAGEVVPTPDDLAWDKPWKKMCASKDGWCPSILEGTLAGKKWCKEGRCYDKHREQSYEIYLEWGPVLDEFCGGQFGLWPAQTIRTESFGKIFSKTKSGTKECGLASVDREHAKQVNVNACDPIANLWATCWYRNNRLIRLREIRPAIIHAPIEDQWLLAGAGGSVGMGKVAELLDLSGALRTKDGQLVHSHPYKRMVLFLQGLHSKWKRARGIKLRSKTVGINKAISEAGLSAKQWKYLGKFGQLYDRIGPFSKIFGWRPGRTAFRISRPLAVAELMKTMYSDGKLPWGEPELPSRPAGLYPYPGDKDHCRCGLWPELKERVPTEAERAQWLESLDGTAPLPPERWSQ